MQGDDRDQLEEITRNNPKSAWTDQKQDHVWWRERNEQDATNPMFIIKLLSQHVSGIIMPIIRRSRPCTTACGVCTGCGRLWLCGCASWAVCTVWRLLFDCWDRSLMINIRSVASCWLLSLHPTSMMHGHKNLKPHFIFAISRVKTGCDGTRAETRFGLPAKRTSPFISAGVSVQSSTGFLGVRVGGERL